MIHFTLVVIIVTTGQAEVAAPPVAAPPPMRMERDPRLIYMTCDRCHWENGYDNMSSAKQGMASHTRWCKRGHGRKASLF